MGQDIEIRLVAQSAPYVKEINNAIQANQKLNKEVETGTKSRLSLIEKERIRVEGLAKSRDMAKDLANLRIYNRLLEDSKNRLNNLEQAGLQQKKSSEGMFSGLAKFGAQLLTVTAAIKFFKAELESTGGSALQFKAAIAGAKNGLDIFLKSFSTGDWSNFFQRFKDGVKAGQEFAKQQATIAGLRREAQIKEAKYDIQIEEQRRIAYEDDKTGYDAKLAAYAEMLRLMKLKADEEIRIAKDTYESTAAFQDSRNRLTKEERLVLTENYDALVRIGRKFVLDKKAISKEEAAILFKTLDENKISLDRLKYLVLNYEDLTVEEKDAIKDTYLEILRAQNEFNVESKRVYRMQQNMIDAQRKSIGGGLPLQMKGKYSEMSVSELEIFIENYKEAIEMQKEAQEQLGETKPKQKSPLEIFMELGERAAKSNAAIEKYNKDTNDKEKKDIEDKIKNYQELSRAVMSFATSMADRLEQDAQRRRELLDTQVSELENELQTEVELYKAGYASNVGAKKKELEDTKRLRDKAIADENRAVRIQQTLGAIAQGVDLASSAASIIKEATKSKGYWGLIIAVAGIASMLGIWANSKQNIKTQLAEGGSGDDTGMFKGRSHAYGGERFLDHVEVEHGERWGVLSRSASRKYGPIFDQMVHSFNKHQIQSPVVGTNINNVIVENAGPNKRLDLIHGELRKQREEITETAIGTVIRKGNSVRTIRR